MCCNIPNQCKNNCATISRVQHYPPWSLYTCNVKNSPLFKSQMIDPEPTDCVKLVAFLTLRLGAVNFTKPRFPNLWAVPNNIHTAASPLFSELEIIYPRTYKLLKLLLLV